MILILRMIGSCNLILINKVLSNDIHLYANTAAQFLCLKISSYSWNKRYVILKLLNVFLIDVDYFVQQCSCKLGRNGRLIIRFLAKRWSLSIMHVFVPRHVRIITNRFTAASNTFECFA